MRLAQMVSRWTGGATTFSGPKSVDHLGDANILLRLEIERFVKHAPSAQTAIDIFKGQWACDLAPLAPGTISGTALLFGEDRRPEIGARAAGGLDGKRVLEIGPLEAAHTWRLERLGAREVVAIETSVESYLKCLIVKELAPLRRSTFLLGDALLYLEDTTEMFDLVFCSGVLYHLADPFLMIKAIAKVTDHVFVWTHFIRDDCPSDATNFGPKNFRRTVVDREGKALTYYVGTYQDRRSKKFWGGNHSTCVWMTLQSLLDGLQHCGFNRIDIDHIDNDHDAGPCVTLNAHKA